MCMPEYIVYYICRIPFAKKTKNRKIVNFFFFQTIIERSTIKFPIIDLAKKKRKNFKKKLLRIVTNESFLWQIEANSCMYRKKYFKKKIKKTLCGVCMSNDCRTEKRNTHFSSVSMYTMYIVHTYSYIVGGAEIDSRKTYTCSYVLWYKAQQCSNPTTSTRTEWYTLLCMLHAVAVYIPYDRVYVFLFDDAHSYVYFVLVFLLFFCLVRFAILYVFRKAHI